MTGPVAPTRLGIVRGLRPWAARALAGAIVALGLASMGQGQSLPYTHNGSGMVVEQSGAQVRITYATPRDGIRAQGVQPGTELFRGTLENGYLSGMANIFRSGCGPIDYYVYGDFRLGQNFVLTGAAPVLAAQGCAIVDNVYDGPNANLSFEVAAAAPQPTPQPIPPGPLVTPQAGARLCVSGVSAGSALSLRVGPGLGYGAIAQIPSGTCDVVAAPAATGGWQALRWQGRIGWASRTYLRPAS